MLCHALCGQNHKAFSAGICLLSYALHLLISDDISGYFQVLVTNDYSVIEYSLLITDY